MSSTRLAVFFSGTDMTFEDLGLLGLRAKDRHNLKNKTSSEDGFYIFDGPAAATSNQHKPVEHIVYDKKQDDFLKARPRIIQNNVGYRFRWATGYGMKKIREAAYQLILDNIINHGVRNIDLFGFSRGGAIALDVGATLSRLDTDLKGKLPEEINVNIYVADPVAGKGNNLAASHLGPLSRFVKKCIVGLATNESVPGFHPRGILSRNKRYNIQFGKAQYVILPFPEDHLMCFSGWMKDIFLCNIPKNSPLLLDEKAASEQEKHLIERRLGINKEVKWTKGPDETRAYRLVHFFKNKDKYTRKLVPDLENKNTSTIKEGIETFFRFIGTQHSIVNIGHVSLQNDADTEKKDRVYENKQIGGIRDATKNTQEKYAKSNNHKSEMGFSDRVCKIKLSEFTNTIFVNVLHESMFIKSYPHLYHLLFYRDLNSLDNAINEFQNISEENFPFTKMYVETALLSINKLRLKPLEQLKSTNVNSHDELIKMVIGDVTKMDYELDIKQTRHELANLGLAPSISDEVFSYIQNKVDDDCQILKLKNRVSSLITQPESTIGESKLTSKPR